MPAGRSQEYMGDIWGIHKEQKDRMAGSGGEGGLRLHLHGPRGLVVPFCTEAVFVRGQHPEGGEDLFSPVDYFFSRCTYGIDGRTYEVDLFFPGCLPPYWFFATASLKLWGLDLGEICGSTSFPSSSSLGWFSDAFLDGMVFVRTLSLYPPLHRRSWGPKREYVV
jgi:hypothetical protein